MSVAQKKTINKILLSLRLPVRDQFRDRPPINFNTNGMPNSQVTARLRVNIAKKKVYNSPVFSNNSVPSGFKTRNNPEFRPQRQSANTNARQALRRHREAFGN